MTTEPEAATKPEPDSGAGLDPRTGTGPAPDEADGSPPSGSARAPRSRVWIGDKVLVDDADEPAVTELLHKHKDACAWAVIEPTDAERIDGLIDRFGLDDWVRRDLTFTSGLSRSPMAVPYLNSDRDRAKNLRPQIKYEEFDRVRLVVTAAVQLTESFSVPDADDSRGSSTRRSDATSAPLDIRPVALVITPRLLLVVARPEDGELLRRHLDNLQPRLADGGSERAAQGVLHALVGSYYVVLQAIEDAGDDLADSLFDLQPLDPAEKGLVFRLRRTVTELRRVTGPMREVVQSLGQTADGDPSVISRGWSLLNEHQIAVSSAADDLRDSLGALFDTSLAFDDSRMNEVMKKLTGWAAIVAVPTLVTGFAGMNVPYWLTGKSSGFYVYLVIMLAGVVALFIVFRQKKWI